LLLALSRRQRRNSLRLLSFSPLHYFVTFTLHRTVSLRDVWILFFAVNLQLWVFQYGVQSATVMKTSKQLPKQSRQLHLEDLPSGAGRLHVQGLYAIQKQARFARFVLRTVDAVLFRDAQSLHKPRSLRQHTGHIDQLFEAH
jgi:hypothetical protein